MAESPPVVWGFTKAGVGTTLVGEFGKRALLFDCGTLGPEPERVAGKTQHVFISHCHADHMAAAFLHARIRGMLKLPRGKYCLPAEAVPAFLRAKAAFEALDAGCACASEHGESGHESSSSSGGGSSSPALPMEVVGVRPGDEVDAGNGLVVLVCAALHRVPAVGYAVRRSKRVLRPELAVLSPAEKQAFFRGQDKNAAVEAHTVIQWTDFAYTGDTLIDAVRLGDGPSAPIFQQARTLCLEMTFLGDQLASDAPVAAASGDQAAGTGTGAGSTSSKRASNRHRGNAAVSGVSVQFARDKGHVHMDEFFSCCADGAFDACERIMLVHFSARSAPELVGRALVAGLPRATLVKLEPLMDCFGLEKSLRQGFVLAQLLAKELLADDAALELAQDWAVDESLWKRASLLWWNAQIPARASLRLGDAAAVNAWVAQPTFERAPGFCLWLGAHLTRAHRSVVMVPLGPGRACAPEAGESGRVELSNADWVPPPGGDRDSVQLFALFGRNLGHSLGLEQAKLGERPVVRYSIAPAVELVVLNIRVELSS